MFNIKQFILFIVAVYAVCAVDESNKGKAVEEEDEANEALDDETIEHHVIIRTPGRPEINVFKYPGVLEINGTTISEVNGCSSLVLLFNNGERLTVKFESSSSIIDPLMFNRDNLDGGASTSYDLADAVFLEVAIVFNGERVPGCMIFGNKDIIIDRNADRLLINGKVVPGVTGQDVMIIDYNRGGGITVNGKRTEGFDDIKGVGSTILLGPNSTRRGDSIRRLIVG